MKNGIRKFNIELDIDFAFNNEKGHTDFLNYTSVEYQKRRHVGDVVLFQGYKIARQRNIKQKKCCIDPFPRY
jgi:hypothetical protein